MKNAVFIHPKVLLLSAFLVLSFGAALAQTKARPCIGLTISASAKLIQMKALREYRLNYDIRNCGNESFSLDTLQRAWLREDDLLQHSINIKPYYFDPKRGMVLVPYTGDMDDVEDYTSNTSVVLEPGQSYTFHFPILRYFYGLRAGEYRILATYSLPANGTGGYYIWESPERVDLKIHKDGVGSVTAIYWKRWLAFCHKLFEVY